MKDKILEAAVRIAVRKGFKAVTRDAVAVEAGVASGTVSYHWNTIAKLQSAVVRNAIDTNNAHVLAGALACGHHLAKTAPTALRSLAARLICAS